jgi:3-hydroxy-3-methylglutaryl CoA synthase
MTGAVGIERIHCYPTTLALDLATLCAAQGYDTAFVRDDLMVDERGLNPPWEDTVTLAVNAAAPIVSDADRNAIGLLIVGTESGVDGEKSISTWVHRYLGLGPRCRNFEIKNACYGTTAGLRMALAWLATAEADGRKALIINADQSLIALGHAYETVMGAAGVAVLVSRQPRLVAYEPRASGIHAFEVTDVFRPTPRIETGDGELSMVSYLEALDGAFADYRERVPASADLDAHFDWSIYHMPFPGMALRAHRALLGDYAGISRAEALRHFERKCRPSIAYARRTGGSYGGSTLIGLLSLVDTAPGIAAGQRVGIFAYGSGSCAELYAVRLLPEAAEAAAEAALPRALDGRRRVSFAEYAAVERDRDRGVMASDFRPDLGLLGEWYGARYEGRGLLILDRIQGYYRHYRWS